MVRAGVLVLVAGALVLPPAAVAGNGSFVSSDPLLNRIWAASVATARDMLVPGPLTVDAEGDPCAIALPVVIVDGTDRDRCPYVGDLTVTDMTLLVSTPSAQNAIRDELVWFAQAQHADGAIPASPLASADPSLAGSFAGGNLMLFDSPSFWVQCLHDYVLYTGDLDLASRLWPNLVALLNRWYPAHVGAGGLLANDLGWGDYAFIPRGGTLVAYYNAGYALALQDAASLATWTGNRVEAQSWTARAVSLAAPFDAAFYDGAVGAYRDSTTGSIVHPEDGNAFAILAGLASRPEALAALRYLSAKDTRAWGNTIADTDAWDGPPWGEEAEQRVFPFMSYFEVLARFATAQDASALGLLRREWGWMLTHGPESTLWEDIGPYGGAPRDRRPSWDHGWSSGAAPDLTAYVLGVRPTSPGFATFVVDPHPGKAVTSASGTVPTPRGDVHVAWRKRNGKVSVTVSAPAGERWANRSVYVPASHAARSGQVPRRR